MNGNELRFMLNNPGLYSNYMATSGINPTTTGQASAYVLEKSILRAFKKFATPELMKLSKSEKVIPRNRGFIEYVTACLEKETNAEKLEIIHNELISCESAVDVLSWLTKLKNRKFK